MKLGAIKLDGIDQIWELGFGQVHCVIQPTLCGYLEEFVSECRDVRLLGRHERQFVVGEASDVLLIDLIADGESS